MWLNLTCHVHGLDLGSRGHVLGLVELGGRARVARAIDCKVLSYAQVMFVCGE